MTQFPYDIEQIKIAYWTVGVLGVIAGIMLVRVWDRFTSRAPRAGFYRCKDCRWVYFRDQNGKWSGAVFDENNLPLTTRTGVYTDDDFRDIYGDCCGKLTRIQDVEVTL